MKLSLLIPTMPKRQVFFGRLQAELWGQMLPYAGSIELVSDDNMCINIGQKRNELLQKAQGQYVVSIDDDDWISPNYVRHMMDAIESECDCASLKGVYIVDGVRDGIFEHSIKYKKWKTTPNEVKYERYPTPLNLIKASIAKQFSFPDKTFGEDHDWSRQIHESGLLKKEYYIPEIIYYYNFISNK